MSKQRLPVTEAKRTALIKELGTLAHLVRGSLVMTRKKCGRKLCACAKGKLHPHTYLSISSGGKRNRIVYVTATQMEAVRNGIAAYQRAWTILDELTAINVRHIKEG